jgi:hypothetical protein
MSFNSLSAGNDMSTLFAPIRLGNVEAPKEISKAPMKTRLALWKMIEKIDLALLEAVQC